MAAIRLKDLKRMMKDKQHRAGGKVVDVDSKSKKFTKFSAKVRKREKEVETNEPKRLKAKEQVAPVTETMPKALVSNEYEEENEEDSEMTADKDNDSSLPADFFDTKPDIVQPEEKEKSKPSSQGQLPEGFFDDPRKDAKARKVEYKDKMDDEWEAFQKSIKAETQVSEAITEADAEDDKEERSLREAIEQRDFVGRVVTLWEQKDKLRKPDMASAEGDDVIDDDSDEDFDDFLDWRIKKV